MIKLIKLKKLELEDRQSYGNLIKYFEVNDLVGHPLHELNSYEKNRYV